MWAGSGHLRRYGVLQDQWNGPLWLVDYTTVLHSLVLDKRRPKDRVRYGYTDVPQVFYGFSLGGSYKGFSLSVLFQGAAKVSKMLSSYTAFAFYNNGIVCLRERRCSMCEQELPQFLHTIGKHHRQYRPVKYHKDVLWNTYSHTTLIQRRNKH